MDILFGGPAAPSRSRIGTVQLDASLSELHGNAGSVTKHPVSAGANIADHVQLESPVVQITGEITNTPIDLPETQADGVQPSTAEFEWKSSLGGGVIRQAAQFVGDLLGLTGNVGTVNTFAPRFDRVRDCHEELLRLRAERQPIVIVTGLKTYENMVLLAVDVRRDASTGHALDFTAVAEQVKIVSTQSADALPDPEELRGLAAANKGPQPAAPAPEATAQRRSGALQAAQAVGLMD